MVNYCLPTGATNIHVCSQLVALSTPLTETEVKEIHRHYSTLSAYM